MTDRIRALLQRWDQRQSTYRGDNYNYSIDSDSYDGSEPFHREWMRREADGAPYTIKLAAAQAAWRASVRPEPETYQLIAGTNLPPAIIACYTGVFIWDLVLMREYAARCPDGEEIVAYWERYLQNREPIPHDADRSPSFYRFVSGSGIACHSLQDYALVLSGGLNGLREKVRKYENLNPGAAEWYAAVQLALDGAAGYIRAHARALEQKAQDMSYDEKQRREWLMMAENCRVLALGEPPVTFLQACQLFWFIFKLNGHDSPGRIDRFLYPALRAELEAGTITEERAQEITDCLYLKMADYTAYGATIGGQTPEGEDATNTMTWLCLRAIRRLRLVSPRTGLRVHEGTPDALFREAVAALAEGTTFPHMINDNTAVEAMVKRGVKPEDARDYSLCGCGQVMPFGRAHGGYEDIICNCAKAFTVTVNGGCDEMTGDRAGLDFGQSFETYEEFESAVFGQIEHALCAAVSLQNRVRQWETRHMTDPLRSALTHGCVERGRDIRRGGTDYHQGMVDAVGLPTLANCLCAMKYIVYDKKLVSYKRLMRALQSDFTGEEGTAVRALCCAAPKYGNDDDYADDIMVRLTRYVNHVLDSQKTFMGGPWGIDIIGWSGSVLLGEQTGATPDGRRAGAPLADCAGPAQGTDTNGITAVLRSAAKLPASDTHGPLNLSLRLSPDSVRGEKQKLLEALIKTYFKNGGYQLQPSVISREQMLAAQREPEKWRSLIVRVGGFSARFVDLDTRFQEDMLARTEQKPV